MKLSSQDITYLNSILATCAMTGIESIIIEDGTVRGVNEAKTCAIISDTNIPTLAQKIGLTRLQTLRQRLELFTDPTIDAKETERGEISMLDISAGKNKVQYRCTASMLIKAPKQINDNYVNRVFIDDQENKLLLNAIKVMGSKKVQLTIKKDRTVSIHLVDATNDAFSTVLQLPAERLTDDDLDSVVFYYPADILASILRTQPDSGSPIELDVGEVGTIKLQAGGHRVTLLPQINEDAEE